MKITPSATPDDPEDDTERNIRILKEIADLGMEMARAVTENAVNTVRAGQLLPGRDPSSAFDRIMKEVRETIAMAAMLERRRQSTAQPPTGSLARGRAIVAAVLLERVKKRVWHAIDRSLQAEPDRRYVEQKMQAVQLRLDDPTFAIEFADQPTGAIVATLCEKLKIPFNGMRWTDEELGIGRHEDAPPPAKLH